MQRKQQRNHEISKAIIEIKQVLKEEVSVQTLEQAKAIMLSLALRRDLFQWADFPLPNEKEVFRTFLVHQEEDGAYALYVNSSLPGQFSPPHDHGGSWAIVVAVEGEELHKVYRRNERKIQKLSSPISQVGEILVEPGNGISILPEGIHSIQMKSDVPLLHLHLYAKGFEYQGERNEYNLETGEVKCFKLEEVGLIEDAR